jgi:uncharacterized membrane protein
MTFALTAAAGAIRLALLPRFGLWLDEIYVRQAASGPFAESLRTVHFVHFFAVKPGLWLSESDFGLRLASALFGTACVPLAYAAARRAFGTGTALLFAGFVAFSPYFVNYSIDANYYSHVMFWSLLGLMFTVRAFETRQPGWLVALVAFAPSAFSSILSAHYIFSHSGW